MRKTIVLLSITIFFLISCKKQNHLTVSTIAGSGLTGMADGNSLEASFSDPKGLCLDDKGNVYVADSRNNKIRKVSPQGVVTTIAGDGSPGSKDGKGADASFFDPAAVAADKNGNIYVADKQNNLIRKITPGGMVSTMAGKWEKNEENAGKFPVFDYPTGVAVDAAGTIYIADSFHNKIRKIGRDGKIVILAGNAAPGSNDGKGTAASFFVPEGIAVDRVGNVYVSDSDNNMIRKITKDGIVTTLAGKKAKGKANGKGAAASFSHPEGIAVDNNNNVYVADSGNNLIRKITPGGVVSTFSGCGVRGAQNGTANEASFYQPMSIAVDTNGNVFVADYQNNMVREISK